MKREKRGMGFFASSNSAINTFICWLSKCGGRRMRARPPSPTPSASSMTVQFATPMRFPPCFLVFELPCRQVTAEPTLIDISSSDLHETSAQEFPCSINVACAYQNSSYLHNANARKLATWRSTVRPARITGRLLGCGRQELVERARIGGHTDDRDHPFRRIATTCSERSRPAVRAVLRLATMAPSSLTASNLNLPCNRGKFPGACLALGWGREDKFGEGRDLDAGDAEAGP
jgi:hypothetical protein